MNNQNIANLCIRCGKQRIIVKTHQELVGSGMVQYTETTCPNLDCQKKVDNELRKEKEKREQAISFSTNSKFGRKQNE